MPPLAPWIRSMLGRISVQAYCYDKHLGVHEAKDWVKRSGAPAEAVSVEEVPCTETSLAMFDKLIDSGVVREDGTIRKCMEVWVGDVVLADELRKYEDSVQPYLDATRLIYKELNFLYLLVDPLKRIVTTFYHQFGAMVAEN
ncbi:cilia- and flagella-associated protein 300-like [Pollicipes pollicipes]|uniref:cilia- and flagella-associated protein 300-like n=1 Tax=Pollicipes pollicipes TaxID=41117 RepID=UPI0018850768|nr:cilia- and flagella-associated protein 300-like [Pollicipes pollicipes]